MARGLVARGFGNGAGAAFSVVGAADKVAVAGLDDVELDAIHATRANVTRLDATRNSEQQVHTFLEFAKLSTISQQEQSGRRER